jgi:hypothetical protein
MRARTLSKIVTALGLLAAWASASQGPGDAISLAKLPPTRLPEYRVDPYIEAAGWLQALGKQAATQELLRLARSPLAEAQKRMEVGGGDKAIKMWTNILHSSTSSVFEERQKIAVLCRMLFSRRPGSDFKDARLGGPSFLGQDLGHTIYSTSDPIFNKWPLEPVELVDDIPFAVVTGYGYEGWFDPRGAELYVRYCMTNCDWSSARFTTKSKEQKETALRKLVSSPKWERPLEGWEREYLTKQLE